MSLWLPGRWHVLPGWCKWRVPVEIQCRLEVLAALFCCTAATKFKKPQGAEELGLLWERCAVEGDVLLHAESLTDHLLLRALSGGFQAQVMSALVAVDMFASVKGTGGCASRRE